MESLTANISRLNPLKVNTFPVLISFFFTCLHPLKSQNLIAYDSIPIPSPELVSIDRIDNIYLSDASGKITKCINGTDSLISFSPRKSADVTLLEAWQGIRTFVFYRDFQEFLYLNRFLAPSESHRISNPEIGYARLIAPSGDGNLWILDESDLSIKKMNLQTKQILLKTPLTNIVTNENTNFNFIKEYKNLLFLNDRNGKILLFDNFGNYLKRLPVKEVSLFNFFNDELYYLKGDQIVFYDIFKNQFRTMALEEDNPYKLVLLNQKRLFLFADNFLQIYGY